MSSGPVSRSDIDIANRGAENFIRLYYAAYDSPTRAETVAKFYRPTSIFNWNGTSVMGNDKIKDFLATIPSSKHEVQSSDCHAVPGTGTADTPPSLLVVVSGTVAHGQMDLNAKNINNVPRTFSQTFLMIPEVPGAIGQAAEPKYFVSADTMRFVG